MDEIYQESLTCPYCAEQIEVLINSEDLSQEYIEDCQVCCRPMTLVVSTNMNGKLQVTAYGEDETF